VSQISPPIRIVLVAVIGLIAAWMLFLRPRTEPVPAPTPAPATAPGVTGLSNAVDGAKDAVAAQEQRDAKVQKATGEDAATKDGKAGTDSATALVSGRVLPLEPLPAEATKGLPRKIVRALDNRQVFVVGVFDTAETRWSRMAPDDRQTRRELSKANRYGGKVVVTSARLGQLSKLHAVIGGVGVTQAPSIVVVDRNREAVVLAGYVDRNAINQAIADARRNSIERRVREPFVRRLNETCANYFLRLDRFNLPTTRAGIQPALRRLEGLTAVYRSGFGSLAAPARYKALQSQLSTVLTRQNAVVSAVRSGNFQRMSTSFDALVLAAGSLDRRLASAGATSCVFNRKA
jgi:hypothetical protein